MTVPGTLYIISAPSGAGKSSLINALFKTQPTYDAQISISHTTRKKRSGESEGYDYYFVSIKKFKEMIAANEFLEYAEVFGHYYGTSRNNIEKIIAQGIDIFLDIDWQGAQQIRKILPQTRTLFILPPSIPELKRRLLGRAQDSQHVIEQRMAQARDEMIHYSEYDYLIINDDFDTALSDLKTILRAERLRLSRQKQRHHVLISKLLAK